MDSTLYDSTLSNLKEKIKSYPDFPKEGIIFRYVTNFALQVVEHCNLMTNLILFLFQRHIFYFERSSMLEKCH